MSIPQSIDADVFAKAYRDAFTSGIGIMKAEYVPYNEVFRWPFRPLPGRSHAHSRKIMRERRAREPVTIDMLKISYEILPSPAGGRR
jgi:hypothetical protein